MCNCTPSISAPWCNRCYFGPNDNAPVIFQPGLASYCHVYSDWHYPNKYIQTEVTPKMIEAG